ncbi:methyltransferase [Amycolatopsis sp. NPDC058986]|uniref:methyltransferase n=1 Tax=unclassified Amycolatopsis TaxID=2618356 RepID=UPI003671377F
MDTQGTGPGVYDKFNRSEADLPPEQRVLGLLYVKWILGAVRAIVELEVPDALAGGPRTVAEIAAATNTQPDPLYRMLRAVAATGILTEGGDGRFALTRLSTGLASGVDGGSRDMLLFATDPMFWRPYENLAHTARTGETAFSATFGMSFYDYLKANPDSAALFNRAMVQNHWPLTDQLIAEFDFGRFPRIADIGGGKGQFLAQILRLHPGSTGVLADQPHTVAEATEVLEKAGVADRVTVVPTDFFVEVPAGCDAYFVKHTLHNWDDAEAERILRRIREAIGGNDAARLLILDQVLRGPGEWDNGKLIDVEAMAVIGGRERNREEWHRIASAAGFAPVTEPKEGDLALLEYRPV